MTGATAFQKATASGEINQFARQEFLSLYSNTTRHIYKPLGDENWKVSRFKLATGLIDAAISASADYYYGAFWGSETPFAVFDIDFGSQYHDAQELNRLRTDLRSIGLSKTCIFQSSRSNGWHLYIPFAKPSPSNEVEQRLKDFLRFKGYNITCGQLEVFPSGNALRLPLQSGFGWLDATGKLLIRREQLTTEAALKQFLTELKANTNDWNIAKTGIESRLNEISQSAGNAGDAGAGRHEKCLSTEGFDGLFNSRMIRKNYEIGRDYWHRGLTAKNQRHDAILCVEHYLWHGDQGAGLPAMPGRFNDEARFRLIRAWLEAKHNGHSWQVAAGNWRTIEAQIRRACTWRHKSTARMFEPYPCTERAQDVLIARTKQTGRIWTMDDLKKGNDGREERARTKIKRAVSQMVDAGQQLTRNAVAKWSRCSPNTVSRHPDLWFLLPSGSGDENRGVQGGSALLGSVVPKSTDLKLIRRRRVRDFLKGFQTRLKKSPGHNPALEQKNVRPGSSQRAGIRDRLRCLLLTRTEKFAASIYRLLIDAGGRGSYKFVRARARNFCMAIETLR